MGGEVSVDSTEGIGTTFSVQLAMKAHIIPELQEEKYDYDEEDEESQSASDSYNSSNN